MTANHVEHGIATFPGSPSRQCRYMSGAEPNATLRVGLMVRPETARVSFCPTQAPSSRKPGLFFKSRPRRMDDVDVLVGLLGNGQHGRIAPTRIVVFIRHQISVRIGVTGLSSPRNSEDVTVSRLFSF